MRIDGRYHDNMNQASADSSIRAANVKRALEEQGLGNSGEAAQTETLHNLGLQNTMTQLERGKEQEKRQVESDTAAAIAELEAKRDKDYAENQIKIAKEVASQQSTDRNYAASQAAKASKGSSSASDGYQPYAGILGALNKSGFQYPSINKGKPITPGLSADELLNNIINQHITNDWNGVNVDKEAVGTAIKAFLKDTSVSESYRAEMRVLAIAMGYL